MLKRPAQHHHQLPPTKRTRTAPPLDLDKAPGLLSSYTSTLARRPNLPPGTKKKPPGAEFGYVTVSGPEAKEHLVIANVTLPAHCPCPVKHASSDRNGKTKAEAKKEAVGILLGELWRCGEVGDNYLALDQQLEPVPTPLLQHTSQEGISSILCQEPIFWKACSEAAAGQTVDPLRYHPTLITFHRVPVCSLTSSEPVVPPETWQPRPILLLTRLPFPPLLPVKLLITKQPTELTVRHLPPIILPGRPEQASLEAFTIRLLRAVAGKLLGVAKGQTEPAYLIAPVVEPTIPSLDAPLIDWDEIRYASGENFVVPFETDLDKLEEQVKDGVVMSKTENGRRYEILRLRRDLTPLSKLEDSPREAGFSSLYDYIKSRARFFGTLDTNQPLLEVRRLRPMTSHLRYLNKEEAGIEASANGAHEKKGEEMKYMIPEILYKSVIRASTFKSAVFLPSILFRIDALLLAKEVNSIVLYNMIDERLLSLALSSPTLASFEGDSDVLEFQGDAVLKMIATVYVFATNSKSSEGELHMLRRHMITNDALRQVCIFAGLAPYLQTKILGVKTWVPHGMGTLDAAGLSVGRQPNRMDVGDKQLADLIEAILGAAWLTGGLEVAWRVAKRLHVGPFPNINEWSDFALVNPGAVPSVPGTMVDRVRRASGLLGCRFRDDALLACALSSGTANHTWFQRLEFLGDAVLDLITIQYIKDKWTNLCPEYIGMLKSQMVSNNALSAFCVNAGLHAVLHVDSPQLASQLVQYATKVTEAKRAEEAEAKAEDRQFKIYWTEVEAPKVASDLVEAVIGGLMVDSKFNYEAVRQVFFNGLVKPFFDRYIHGLQSLPIQPAAILSNMLQQKGCKSWEISKSMVDQTSNSQAKAEVVIHENVLSWTICATPQMANRKACEHALRVIEKEVRGLDAFCDCAHSTGKSKNKIK